MINKIYNRLCRGLLYCGVVAVFTACTDTWDDHYDGVATGVQEGSLWQAIQQNDQLSNWERDVLTDKQKVYAATDAWACVMLYEEYVRLKKTKDYFLEKVIEEEENKI